MNREMRKDRNDTSVTPGQFFPRGKNGPANSFPGEKTDRYTVTVDLARSDIKCYIRAVG